jgi:hypothetical protein
MQRRRTNVVTPPRVSRDLRSNKSDIRETVQCSSDLGGPNLSGRSYAGLIE